MANPTTRILAYGDSLTAGYCDMGQRFAPYANTLASKLGVEVVPYGCSGWTTTQLLRSVDCEKCIDVCGMENPGLRVALRAGEREGRPYTGVILMAGTNDLADGVAPHDIAANLLRLHATAREMHCRSVAIGIPDSAFCSACPEPNTIRLSTNALLTAAADGVNLAYIDCPLQFDRHNGFWERDGLHLSPSGSEALALGIASDVQQALCV